MARILLIEDDLVAASFFRINASQCGHEVIHATNGASGLEFYQTNEFELVATDVLMPEKDGLETIEEILNLNDRQTILALSGGGSISDGSFYLDAALKIGARKILQKPYEPEELIDAFRELLPN
jgi:DNA-binding response OmpR family regulator